MKELVYLLVNYLVRGSGVAKYKKVGKPRESSFNCKIDLEVKMLWNWSFLNRGPLTFQTNKWT